MRIGIVADTHGVLDARVEAALAGADLIVHAGDVGDARVLDALASLGGRLIAVRGNNDSPGKWPSAQHARLDSLPPVARAAVPGGEIVVVHGDRDGPPRRRHSRLRARFPEARLIAYGHSHRLCVDRAESPWVVNPGAAGRARTYGGPSLLLLDAADSEWTLRQRRFAPPQRGRR